MISRLQGSYDDDDTKNDARCNAYLRDDGTKGTSATSASGFPPTTPLHANSNKTEKKMRKKLKYNEVKVENSKMNQNTPRFPNSLKATRFSRLTMQITILLKF
jgi:hypothetical protein